MGRGRGRGVENKLLKLNIGEKRIPIRFIITEVVGARGGSDICERNRIKSVNICTSSRDMGGNQGRQRFGSVVVKEPGNSGSNSSTGRRGGGGDLKNG